MALQRVYIDNQNCTDCIFHKSRLQVVPGQGNPNAELMIIGEAPGKTENVAGFPFIGASGFLLWNFLFPYLNISKESIFLTNAIKCVEGRTQIPTIKGNKSIDWVVKYKWKGKVKSINQKGEIEWKKIEGWYRSKLNKRKLYKVFFLNGKGNVKGIVGSRLTEDHEVSTKKGWVEVRDLKRGDMVATGTPSPGKRAEQVFIGSLLGDGCLPKGRATYTEGHSIKQYHYLKLKVKILKGFSPLFRKVKIDKYSTCRMSLKNTLYLKELRKKWYINNKKTIRMDNIKKINKFGLAIWYMDDGSWVYHHKHLKGIRVEIALGMISKTEIEIIKTFMASRGYKIRINFSSIWRLAFRGDKEGRKFLKDIAKYILPSMRYKLPLELRKIKYENNFYEEKVNTHYSPIDKKEVTPKCKTVYCIDVEDNHNFVTPGGVVHNCFPGNRKVTSEHVQICRKYLFEEIRQVRPKYIITLGEPALISLLEKKPAGFSFPSIFDYVLDDMNITVMSTYHPAFTLRKLGHLPFHQKDFITFANYKKGYQSFKEGEYKTVRTLSELRELYNEINVAKLITVDIETNTLEGNIITGIAFSTAPQKGWFVPLLREAKVFPYTMRKKECSITLGEDIAIWSKENYEIVQRTVKNILENHEIKKIFHNGDFDIKNLYKEGYKVNGFFFDTIVAAPLIDETLDSKKLKDLAYLYLNFPYYDKELKPYLEKIPKKVGKNYMGIPLEVLGKYACMDVDATMQLYCTFASKAKGQSYENIMYNISMPVREIMTQATITGIKINKAKVEQLQKKYTEDLITLENEIWEITGYKFNVRSSPQLGDVLFRKMGLPIIKMTEKTRQPSTDKKDLEFLKKDYPIIEKVLEFKTKDKLKGTYLDGMLKIVDKDNIVHTVFNVNGTETGRQSSNSPNLQNIPRKSDIRSIFCAREGYSLVPIDYDQLELRIITAFCNDPIFREAFLTGKDIHISNAASIFGVPFEQVSAEQRSIGKTINYGIVYLISKYGLAAQLKIDEVKAEETINRFYNSHPAIVKWIDDIKTFVSKNHYTTNIFGRIRRFPQFDLEKFKGKLLRQAVNFPVQSTGGDMTSIATIRNEKIVAKYGYENARLLLNVHDELIYEVKDEYAEEFKQEAIESMEKPYWETDIPFTVDAKIMKEWKK